jgi:hypothetical protein
MDANLNEERIEDNLPIQQKLKAEFNQFKIKNTQIINGKALLPDSILNKYTKPVK